MDDLKWTPELDAARIALCEFMVEHASDPHTLTVHKDLGARMREAEQALTILGEIANALPPAVSAEDVARVIDPSVWTARDLAFSGDPFTAWNAALDASITEPSLTKARTILALFTPAPITAPAVNKETPK